MRYKLENGKSVNISDKELEKIMKNLEVDKDEAIQIWLEDNDYEVNEEQVALDEKAKKVKIQHGATADKEKKDKKPHTVKTSDEKKELFSTILENLKAYSENVSVLKDNKLIEVKIGEKIFKVDLIEQRPPKK